jgi:hypothetical protein
MQALNPFCRSRHMIHLPMLHLPHYLPHQRNLFRCPVPQELVKVHQIIAADQESIELVGQRCDFRVGLAAGEEERLRLAALDSSIRFVIQFDGSMACGEGKDFVSDFCGEQQER